jgi:hydrogenase nickel incorporation protein HypA/HybF
MHEYSVAQALIGRVEREVAARGGTRVRRLWVRIGEISGVEIGLLQTAYGLCCPRTVCEGAPMEVTRQDARWECPACGATITHGGRLECSACSLPARLVRGDEIMLDRIEMEVA